jgi:hypothetical protein
MELNVALMVLVPAVKAFTRPVLLIDATAVLVDAHVAWLVRSWVVELE